MNRPNKPKLHCKTEKQISDYLLRLESYTTQLEAKYKEAVNLLNRWYKHIEMKPDIVLHGDTLDFLKGAEDE